MDKAAKAAYDREYRARNRERIADNKRMYAAANPAKEQERVTAWVEANRERSREIKAAWKLRNPHESTLAGTPEERLVRRKAAATARTKAWREANPAKYSAASEAYSEANSAKKAARAAAWRGANPTKVRQNSKAYYEANPDVSARGRAARRTGVANASAPWADKVAIKAIYAEARRTGMHVDHEIPLKGKFVSGLHVHTNLRLLTPMANWTKGNRYAD